MAKTAAGADVDEVVKRDADIDAECGSSDG